MCRLKRDQSGGSLLPVALHRPGVARLRVVWILSGVTPSAPLAQQVPAGVKLDRHLSEASAVLLHRLVALCISLLASEQRVLLVD